MILKASDWILHPEGIFRARITAIEPTSRFVEGIPEKTFVIETIPIDAEGPTRSIRHTIYCIQLDSSRFSKMYTAISGKELNTDRGANTDELIGRRRQLVVEHYVKENNQKGHRISKWQPYQECFSHN